MTSKSTFSDQTSESSSGSAPDTPLPSPQATEIAAARPDTAPVESRPADDQVTVGQPEAVHSPLPGAPSYADKQHGEIRDGMPRIVMNQAAVLQVQSHCQSDLAVELGGVLLGHAYREAGELIVEVTAALAAHSDDHSAFHFTFTADTWAQVHRDRDLHYPKLQIIGWFHTHPDLGVFYSGDDVVVHSVAFVMPWHVGLVVDPVRQEAAYFGWEVHGELAEDQKQLAPVRGFAEVIPAGGQTVSPWRIAERAAVWSTYSESDLAPLPRETTPYHIASSVGPTLAPLQQWWGIVAIGVGLIFALSIYFGTIRPLQQRAESLESVAVLLSDQNIAAAEEQGLASCPDGRVRLYAPAPGQPLASGSTTALIGTTTFPEAARYEVRLRTAGNERWVKLADVPAGARFQQLGEWQVPLTGTTNYELALQPLDSTGEALPTAPVCRLTIPIVDR